MRIVAGSLKGRRLKAPTWEGLRPTSDKLRETLFNILAPHIRGANVLDGFAGTGALGIEALSRGARAVTFVESEPRAQALIADNLAHCEIESGYTVLREPMARGVERLKAGPPFDIVLMDPPYQLDADTVLAGADALLADNGVLVLEHARKQGVPDVAGRLVRVRQVASGDSALTLYRLRP
jgi:16S rRNA (guanine(966)-N(2))-methyltransferase RsmD